MRPRGSSVLTMARGVLARSYHDRVYMLFFVHSFVSERVPCARDEQGLP